MKLIIKIKVFYTLNKVKDLILDAPEISRLNSFYLFKDNIRVNKSKAYEETLR